MDINAYCFSGFVENTFYNIVGTKHFRYEKK